MAFAAGGQHCYDLAMAEDVSRFRVDELVALFRDGLVSLIPTAERARVAWKGPRRYDPWEGIERAVFSSFVSSVVENATPAPPKPPPTYGLRYPTYAQHNFLCERGARTRGEILAFLELETRAGPFDTACFLRLATDHSTAGELARVPLSDAGFELAARTGRGLEYLEHVDYAD